jgi:hypothetical protein
VIKVRRLLRSTRSVALKRESSTILGREIAPRQTVVFDDAGEAIVDETTAKRLEGAGIASRSARQFGASMISQGRRKAA